MGITKELPNPVGGGTQRLGTDHGDGADPARFKRQEVTRVLQQDDAFARRVERGQFAPGVIQGNGGVQLLAIQEPKRDHLPQDPAYLVIQDRFGKRSVLDQQAQGSGIHELAGGQVQVAAGQVGIDPVVNGSVVRHHEAGKSPFVF